MHVEKLTQASPKAAHIMCVDAEAVIGAAGHQASCTDTHATKLSSEHQLSVVLAAFLAS
jgi:hypothetical protein